MPRNKKNQRKNKEANAGENIHARLAAPSEEKASTAVAEKHDGKSVKSANESQDRDLLVKDTSKPRTWANLVANPNASQPNASSAQPPSTLPLNPVGYATSTFTSGNISPAVADSNASNDVAALRQRLDNQFGLDTPSNREHGSPSAIVKKHGDSVRENAESSAKQKTQEYGGQSSKDKHQEPDEHIEDAAIQAFREFADAHKLKIANDRRQRSATLEDLKGFGENFKLRTPVPEDLVPQLARGTVKLQEIQAQAIRNAHQHAVDGLMATKDMIKHKGKLSQPGNGNPGRNSGRSEVTGSLDIQKQLENLKLHTQLFKEMQMLQRREYELRLRLAKGQPQISHLNQTSIDHVPFTDFHATGVQESQYLAPISSVISEPGMNLQASSPYVLPYVENHLTPYQAQVTDARIKSFEEARMRVPFVNNQVLVTTDLPRQLDASVIAQDCGLDSVKHDTYPIPLTPIRDLGRGAMGFVEEVYKPGCRSFVRKKIDLRTWDMDDRSRIRAFIKDEIEVMKRLDHHHIVKIIGSYEAEPAIHAILMFPVGDQNLRDFLYETESTVDDSASPIEVPWLLRKWLGCLASAITYLHAEGVQHEDIKPSNIICKGGEIYLTDFSSARQCKIGETTSTFAGARASTLYKAPELFQTGEAGRHGTGTDIFSLGCAFVEMEVVFRGCLQEFRSRPLGRKLKDFRAHCTATIPGDTIRATELAYCKVLHKLDQWFDSSHHEHPPGTLQVWELVIRPMLATKRVDRPSAARVLKTIRLLRYWPEYCVCNSSAQDRSAEIVLQPYGTFHSI